MAPIEGQWIAAFVEVLQPTGANEVAGRRTAGHFDLPLRGCTVELDGQAVVRNGVLL